MKIKVLFVITKSNFGGAQKYVYDIATNLNSDRFEVSVATGGTGLLIQKLKEKQIRIIPILSLSRDVDTASDIRAFFALLFLFIKEKPDVVHLNSAKAGGIGALASRFASVPKIVFTAHGWAFNEDRSALQKIVIKFFSWLTITLSHKTIAVSDAVKNDTRKWPLVNKKIVVIKNGINEPDFYTKEEARAKIFSKIGAVIQQDGFIVGTIAELHKNKGLSYAIEAFAKIIPTNPSLYYFIIGNGEEKEHLDNIIRRHNLQERVFLLGFVDNASRFLHAFDIFILPSNTESLGLVILEAGLARLPVIASNVGGIPEIIESGKTGLLISPRDTNIIIQSVQKLQSDIPFANSLGIALREHVLKNFSLKKTLAETTKIYIAQ